MYCVDCGAQILKDANFCTGCGKVLGDAGKSPKSSKRRVGMLGRFVIAAVFLFFAIPFIGYLSIQSNNGILMPSALSNFLYVLSFIAAVVFIFSPRLRAGRRTDKDNK